MIRITSPSVPRPDSKTDPSNSYIRDFNRTRITLLMHLAAVNGLHCRDYGACGVTYSSYTTGHLEIQVPMGTHKEQFKLNYFLSAVMDLKLLDALTIAYDTTYEKEWVEDFLTTNWSLSYPKLVPTRA